MRSRQIILVVLAFGYFTISAQVMNVRKWRKAERDSLENGMYLIEEEKYLEAIPIFEQLLNNHSGEEFLRYTYAKCALYRGDKHEDAYRYLTELYNRNKKIPDIQFDMALASHYTFHFDEAEEIVGKMLENRKVKGELRGKAEQLKRWVGHAKVIHKQPTNAVVTLMGPHINTKYDEYRPAITADDSLLVFTYAGMKSMGGLQNVFMQPDPFGEFRPDIYYAYKKKQQFDSARANEALNSNLPDEPVALSADGRVMYLFQDLADGHGDLYQSQLSGQSYVTPVKLTGEINSYSWDGHCSVSPNGKTMYFSSERAGGYGGKDIYKATMQADSSWGNVVNLGDSINSEWDDDAPFIHADGVTLFYSSRGKGSMGGHDIFKATLSMPDSVFRNITNVGFPINTPADDLYFVLTADGKKGYYSSARHNGLGMRDIYMIETGKEQMVEPVAVVRGVTTDNDRPVEAEIKVEMTDKDNAVFITTRSNAANGSYLLALPGRNNYKITFSSYGKSTGEINLPSLNSYTFIAHDVEFSGLIEKPIVTAPTKTVPVVTTPIKETIKEEVPVKPVIKGMGIPASSPLLVKNAGFPKTGIQEKTMRYAEMYGRVTDPQLEFRIQVAAVKEDKKITFPNAAQLGKIDKLDLGDGYKRITAGGSFKTLEKALEHNRQVVKAGQEQGFVFALYKGKRMSFDELETAGVFQK